MQIGKEYHEIAKQRGQELLPSSDKALPAAHLVSNSPEYCFWVENTKSDVTLAERRKVGCVCDAFVRCGERIERGISSQN